MLKKSILVSSTLSLFMLLTPILQTINVQAATLENTSSSTNLTATIEEARKVAVNQVITVMKTQNDGKWKSGVKIAHSKALFDLEENVTSYLFELSDSMGNDSGYVVVSAFKDENPIIEYAVEGKPFFDIAIEKTKTITETKKTGKRVKPDKTKLYYLGNMTYLEKQEIDDNTNEIYDISTSDINTVDINKVNKSNLHENRNIEYLKQWNDKSGGSTPPDNGTMITSPASFETGYSSNTSHYCTNYYQSYSTMSSFMSGGVCSPTAGTNLMEYYYHSSIKYLNLYPNSWQTVFNYMYSSMGTTSSGTSDPAIQKAITGYASSRGFNTSSGFYYGTNSGDAIVSQIDGNCPPVLNVHDNTIYGNHSVLALGYQKYTYSSGSKSIYICIADGWSQNGVCYPNRYVWGNCKGTWNYTSFVIL